MHWFDKVKAAFGVKQKEQDHPAAPVLAEDGRPKSYFEYFVHKEPDGMIWFNCRAYLYNKQPGGAFERKVVEMQSPAHSEEHARVAAQAWGAERLKEVV